MPEIEPKAFRDGPHTLKFLRADAKKTIYYAAKRSKVTQGEWLEQAAREKLARERQRDDLSDRDAEVILPSAAEPFPETAVIRPGAALTVTEMEIATRLAVHLAELRGQRVDKKARNASARAVLGVQRLLARRVCEE